MRRKLINEKMVLANYDEYARIVAEAYENAPSYDQSVVSSYRSLIDSKYKRYERFN